MKIPRDVSAFGVSYIAAWEGGAVLTPYNDDGRPSATSRGNCTIGIGKLLHEGPCDGRASEPRSITMAQAVSYFHDDLQRRVAALNRYMTRQLDQDQFDAYLDFAFNCGLGAAQSIAPALNAGGDFCALTAGYVNPPQFRAALTERRRQDCQLWHGNKAGLRQLGPVVAIGDDEMWHRHNEAVDNAFWPKGVHTFPAGADVRIQLGVDLPHVMSRDPSAIDLDLYGRSGGGTLHVFDGDGAYAGRVAPDVTSRTIRVRPVGGTIRLVAADGPVTIGLGCLGYLD